MSETAGENRSRQTGIINYSTSSSLSQVRYRDNFVWTNSRRFVVVRQRSEYCYACPIFTYSGRATTKRGVRPAEHGIVYSWGGSPQLLLGEGGITKPSLPVVMAGGVPHLDKASRIYYGVHHPIQYNVKVKEIGYIPKEQVPSLITNWREEDDEDFGQFAIVTNSANIDADRRMELSDEESSSEICYESGLEMEDVVLQESDVPQMFAKEADLMAKLEVASNPRAFFKKGRVFAALWAERNTNTETASLELARFVVIRPKPAFSVCLRISAGSPQIQPCKEGGDHIAIITADTNLESSLWSDYLQHESIVVKVENKEVTLDADLSINFVKPYTVEHTWKICNIGRVLAPSIALLDRNFAESLGYPRP